jgi:hypothetical protein
MYLKYLSFLGVQLNISTNLSYFLCLLNVPPIFYD